MTIDSSNYKRVYDNGLKLMTTMRQTRIIMQASNDKFVDTFIREI